MSSQNEKNFLSDQTIKFNYGLTISFRIKCFGFSKLDKKNVQNRFFKILSPTRIQQVLHVKGQILLKKTVFIYIL